MSTGDAMEYVEIQTTANANSFGNLTTGRAWLGSCSNASRGMWTGGWTGAFSNVMDYHAIASTGNAGTFGTLVVARHDTCALSGKAS